MLLGFTSSGARQAAIRENRPTGEWGSQRVDDSLRLQAVASIVKSLV